MTDDPFGRVAEDFLAVVLGDDEPSEERLVVVLDDLAAAYHRAPGGKPAPDDGGEAPEAGYDALRGTVGGRFPGLGLYSVAVDPNDPTPRPTGVGDAVDDLVDIVRDLQEFFWRRRTNGSDDALWHLRLSFEAHWGRHLRDLALLLHARRCYAPLGNRVSLAR